MIFFFFELWSCFNSSSSRSSQTLCDRTKWFWCWNCRGRSSVMKIRPRISENYEAIASILTWFWFWKTRVLHCVLCVLEFWDFDRNRIERENDELFLWFSDELALNDWFFFVIGDVASIYRPSVIFWTSSLVTPGFGLEMARPWLDFWQRTILQFWELKGLTCKIKKNLKRDDLDKKGLSCNIWNFGTKVQFDQKDLNEIWPKNKKSLKIR